MAFSHDTAMTFNDMTSTLGSMVARTLLSVSWAQLTGPARDNLKLCLVANLSAGVAGEAFNYLPVPRTSGEHGEGHLLFSGNRTPSVQEAVAWNAATMHARMQDDMNPVSNLHSGTVVIPAAIAALECAELERGKGVVTGEAFLTAIAAGYAASSGLSRAFNHTTTPRGYRSSSLYGIFGAAVAAGLVMDLKEDAINNAIALSASMAAGLSQCWVDGSDEWQLHIAQAASNGFLAARLAKAGMRGAAHALDGRAGFYASHAGRSVAWSDISEGFAPDQALCETLIKRYPMSGIVQPVAYVAERLVSTHRVRAEDVESVTLSMNPFELQYPGTMGKGPFDSFSAVLMSAPFACASVFARGRFVFDDLMDSAQPERERIVRVTEMEADEALASLSCRVRVALRGGKVLQDQLIAGEAGARLGVDAKTIGPWSRELWEAANRRSPSYDRFIETTDDLENRPASELLEALAT